MTTGWAFPQRAAPGKLCWQGPPLDAALKHKARSLLCVKEFIIYMNTLHDENKSTISGSRCCQNH